MFKGILGLLTALPEIIGLLREISKLVRSLTSEKPKDVVRDVKEVFRAKNQAKLSDMSKPEKIKAIDESLRKFNNVIRSG